MKLAMMNWNNWLEAYLAYRVYPKMMVMKMMMVVVLVTEGVWRAKGYAAVQIQAPGRSSTKVRAWGYSRLKPRLSLHASRPWYWGIGGTGGYQQRNLDGLYPQIRIEWGCQL